MRDDLDKFFEKIKSTLYDFNKEDPFVDYLESAYYSGKNTSYQKNMSEQKIFDAGWIKTMESYFPSIDKITKNPRSNLKYENEIVAIEKAKKINSQSVRHLAAHTQFIKKVEDDGKVIPSKILTTNAEQDYAIYENRFIMTLIDRMYLFTRYRYERIKNNVESYQKDHIYTESQFSLDDVDVTMKIDVNIEKDLDDRTVNEENYKLLKRADRLMELITSLKNSNFMKTLYRLKAAKVHPPIMKTNIILKNPDFRDAYNLWLFLDRYNAIDFDTRVQEKQIKFDTKFSQHLKDMVLVNFVTIMGDQLERGDLFNLHDANEYIRRSARQISSRPEDLVVDSGNMKIEDVGLNEYFLNKYKEMLLKNKEDMKAEGKSEDEAMKKALRQMTDIVNGTFENIFQFEEDHNIFNRYVEHDIKQDYTKKKYQIKMARIIRSIKEVDYNQAVRRETKLLRELEKINRELLREKKEELKQMQPDQTSKIDKLQRDILFKQFEIDKCKSDILSFQDDKIIMDYEKEALEELREDVTLNVKKELDAYKQELKEKAQKEKDELSEILAKLKEEGKEIHVKYAKLKRKRDALLKKRLEEEKKQLLLKAQEEKARIKAESEQKRKAQNDDLKKKIKEEKERQMKELIDVEQQAKEDEARAKVKSFEQASKIESLKQGE